jgi:hypothetical protein
MRVVDIRKVEDCFDGSRIYELHLDRECSQSVVNHLAELGQLEYFQDFCRPFFRVLRGKKSVIRGVEGNQHFRVVLFSSLEGELDLIEAHLSGLKG